MATVDLNLLRVLDTLLDEGSVVGAATRLHLSPPAVSRALGRIRAMVGDPVFVRAGRGLVPTPRAEALRPQIRALLDEAGRMLAPDTVDPARLARTFTIRAMDSVATTAGPILAERLRSEAPFVRLLFVAQGDEDVGALRHAEVDLDIGVIGDTGPEVKRQTLYHERMIGVVRDGHPLLRPPITAERFVAAPHVSVSRRGLAHGPIDEALAGLGLSRTVTLVVQHANAALLAAAGSDLVAVLGLSLAHQARRLCLPIAMFDLPVPTPDVPISLAWHPRLDADPEHRWLRDHVRAVLPGPAFGSADEMGN